MICIVFDYLINFSVKHMMITMMVMALVMMHQLS